MSLASQVGLLATRVGTELKSIRNNYVPNSLRGPIGGVSASTGVTGTVTIDPALSNQRRLTLTGATTIAAMAAGVDGQRLLVEATASGGQRTLTFDPSFELSNAVTTRTFTIPTGSWAYVQVICRSGTWRLVSAEPQPAVDYSTPSAWVPADHGQIAWNYDPILATTTFGVASGGLLHAAIKVSVSGTVTMIAHNVATVGTGLTANRNLIGIYNASGNLVAQSVDQTTAWGTTGNKLATLVTALDVTPGTYFAVFLAGGGTTTFAAASVGTASFLGRTQAGWRSAYLPGTATSLPATRPLPTNTSTNVWVGLA